MDANEMNQQVNHAQQVGRLYNQLRESKYERWCLGEAAKVAGALMNRLREPCADGRNCCERCARVEELGR